MTQSHLLPPFLDWPSRRERILALASSLSADLAAVDLDEVDGEFYWRMCRDDLLDPIAQLAGLMAPHILGGEPIDDFSERHQGMIDRYRDRLRQDPDMNEETQQQSIDFLKDQIQQMEFVRAGRDIIRQLPPFVWEHFTTRRRIPMRPPMKINTTRGGKILEVRISSREGSGEQLESLVSPPWASLQQMLQHLQSPPYPQDDDPAEDDDPFEDESFESDETVEDASSEDARPGTEDSRTAYSLHIDFILVKAASLPDSSRLAVSPHEVPFILVTLSLPLPLPPKGIIARAYDAIVREQEQWHLELPGGATKQEKEVAIRTWAVGLLREEGKVSYYDARREVEHAMNRIGVSEPRFQQDRKRLLERVPEAEPFLYVRGRRSSPVTNPRSPRSPS